MFEALRKWNRERKLSTSDAPFPHCDQRVLHSPGTCEYCDYYPHFQELRQAWGISFTGQSGSETRDLGKTWNNMLPCPSDYTRGVGGAHVWSGNRPKAIYDDDCGTQSGGDDCGGTSGNSD